MSSESGPPTPATRSAVVSTLSSGSRGFGASASGEPASPTEVLRRPSVPILLALCAYSAWCLATSKTAPLSLVGDLFGGFPLKDFGGAGSFNMFTA